MNKLIAGGLGLAAAAALLVNGGTFASWSDSYTDSGNSVGASELSLNVGNSGSAKFDKINMYPGGQADYEFFVTSRDGEAVPQADLALKIQGLIDTEDGCTNNTGENTADDCETAGVAGDFSRIASITVNTSVPTTDAEACDLPRDNALPSSVKTLKSLEELGSLNLLRPGVTLKPGEGICVAMAIGLPVSAGNEVQGDYASFNVEFNLTQHI